MNGGGVFSALIFVIGVLLAFALLFGLFLVVPFFIFLAGVIVMLVADRRRDREEAKKIEEETRPEAVGDAGTVRDGS